MVTWHDLGAIALALAGMAFMAGGGLVSFAYSMSDAVPLDGDHGMGYGCLAFFAGVAMVIAAVWMLLA